MNSKLAQLQELCIAKGLDGYILSNSDQFLCEYTKDEDNDLRNYTNFSGSSGIGVFYQGIIHLFTDGRYELQAEKELPQGSKIFISPKHLFLEWIQDKLKGNVIFGLNYRKFRNFYFQGLDKKNLLHISLGNNFIAQQNVFIHDMKFSGESTESKLDKVGKHLNDKNITNLVVEDLDSISWLLNLRSDFYEFNPAIAAKFILSSGIGKIFVDNNLDRKIVEYLNKLKIELFKISDFEAYLDVLDSRETLIEQNCSFLVRSLLPEAKIGLSPIMMLKAQKNEVEISGSISCHIEDAKAIKEFHDWFEREYSAGSYYSEFQISQKITEFRRSKSGYFSNSFPPIVGFKESGAVIHYRPHKEDSKIVKGSGLLLIDSGGQYRNGTTDVTRVFCLGKPTGEVITRYTQVLQGHIDAASYVFEDGETGKTIDELARRYLKEDGLDYAHGTGHGVGSFLNVHEGPYSISSMSKVNLKEGVIVSIEPGYYKKGEFGIRIENLYLVRRKEDGKLFFKPLTLFPFEEKLIDHKRLSGDQVSWLKKYNRLVSKHLFDSK